MLAMDVERSKLQKPNRRAEQCIAGKTVHFSPPQKTLVRFAEDTCPKNQDIPLDVYGKPESYRWRTAYDEAYNMDNEGKWKWQ